MGTNPLTTALEMNGLTVRADSDDNAVVLQYAVEVNKGIVYRVTAHGDNVGKFERHRGCASVKCPRIGSVGYAPSQIKFCIPWRAIDRDGCHIPVTAKINRGYDSQSRGRWADDSMLARATGPQQRKTCDNKYPFQGISLFSKSSPVRPRDARTNPVQSEDKDMAKAKKAPRRKLKGSVVLTTPDGQSVTFAYDLTKNPQKRKNKAAARDTKTVRITIPGEMGQRVRRFLSDLGYRI